MLPESRGRSDGGVGAAAVVGRGTNTSGAIGVGVVAGRGLRSWLTVAVAVSVVGLSIIVVTRPNVSEPGRLGRLRPVDEEAAENESQNGGDDVR